MKITYENKDYDIEYAITVGEAFKEQIENQELKNIIAARLNNSISPSSVIGVFKDTIELFNLAAIIFLSS